jgi:hypothetical protein
MKKVLKTGSLLLIGALLFASCSIEKRHYMPGYHVEWKHKQKTLPVSGENTIQAEETKKLIQSFSPEDDSKQVAGTSVPVTMPEPFSQDEITDRREKQKQANENNPEINNTTNDKGQQFTKAPVTIKKMSLKARSPHISDDARLILAVVFLLFGIPPAAIAVMVGVGPEFWLNILLLVGSILCIVLAMTAFYSGGAFAVFVGLGVICALACFIHAIVVVIQNA